VLDLLDDVAYELLEVRAERLAADLQHAFDAAGIVARVPRFGSLVGLFFGEVAPHDFLSACATDEAVYAAVFHALLERGVAVAPGAYEVMFPGLAHDDDVLGAVADATHAAAVEVAAARNGSALSAAGVPIGEEE
jgi:glutamate-1-semialdehyde 2,1-aminomutase